MTHLYELSDAYRALQETEELTEEELITCLNNVQELFNEKAINIGKLVLSLQADAEGIDTELKRLSERKQAIENRVKGLKFYLAQEMEVTSIDKVKNEILTISLRNSPPSVEVIDEKLIPDDYWREIPSRFEIDKQAILSVYKESSEGVPEIPGVKIITSKKHVVIR